MRARIDHDAHPRGASPRVRLRGALVPAVLVLLLILLGFPSLDRYGVTWDEALGDLFFGERYLSFFTSFDAKYLDFEKDPYPPGHVPDLSGSPFRVRPWEYYPVANVLAAATSDLLSRRLGLLDPFDGFHAVNLLLGALLVVALHAFARRAYGGTAALLAVLLLFLSPRIVCDLMANIKDFPEMVLFTLAMLAAQRAVEHGSARGVLGAGALWGLALGTKANALFLPAIPLAVLLVGSVPPAWRGRGRSLLIALAGAGVVGAIVLLAAWPYLWADPAGRLAAHLRYIAHQKFQTRAESVAPPLEAVLFTTPIPFLALFLLGLVPVWRRALARDRDALLPLAWIGVVLARLHLPGAVNFDGVRHFLEVFPAMALVAGAGGAWVARGIAARAGRRIPARAATALVIALPVASLAWSLARSHPFEIAYWNSLAGGLSGARARGFAQAGDYWGASYRTGLRWMNENAPRGAILAVPIVEHAVRLTAPVWLRPDIRVASLTTPVRPDVDPNRLARLRAVARETPVYVMFVWREDWMNALTNECRERLRPEAEWRLDGAPVLGIYRYPRGG